MSSQSLKDKFPFQVHMERLYLTIYLFVSSMPPNWAAMGSLSLSSKVFRIGVQFLSYFRASLNMAVYSRIEGPEERVESTE